MPGLIGKKIGMTSVFSADGKNVPCTVIEVGPCVVTQVKTVENDGYAAPSARFRGYEGKAPHKPELDICRKPEASSSATWPSSKVSKVNTLGDTITVDFSTALNRRRSGNFQGKGFQGVVKRHGFGGVGQPTHGQHNRLRAPFGRCMLISRESIQGYPHGRQMGNERVTVQNLQVVKIIPEIQHYHDQGLHPRKQRFNRLN